nr:MAG TPA: KP6 killer toxin subunit alpha protein, Secreted, TOXIN.8A [Caudoviricetes sp.]
MAIIPVYCQCHDATNLVRVGAVVTLHGGHKADGRSVVETPSATMAG